MDEFGGFFLCPDYNLMCSGTVICNDMFECVEKKSEIKENSYEYNDDIKTSLNIERAEKDVTDEDNNYELSEDGICPINCKYCLKNKKCIKCRNGYNLENNICIKYKNESNIIDNESIKCYPKGEEEEPHTNISNTQETTNNHTNLSNTQETTNIIIESTGLLDSTISTIEITNNISINIPINIPKTQEIYTMFVLQTQLRGTKLYLYIINNLENFNNLSLLLTINLYMKNNKRNLQLTEGKEIKVKAYANNKMNQITELSAELQNYNITEENIVELKKVEINADNENINYNFDIHLPENSDNLNTEKVDELIKKGGVDFSKKYENSYKISQYKIKNVSEGCNFKLKTSKPITINNNNLFLYFCQLDKSSNISANCQLSINNNYEIPCTLNNEVNNSYTLNDYISYDDNELLTIVPENKSSSFFLSCKDEIKKIIDKKKNSGLSKGAIIAIIIVGALVVIISIAIGFYFCKYKKNKYLNNETTSTNENNQEMNTNMEIIK